MSQQKINSERDLWRKIKNEITTISWIRIENWALLGTPDLLGYSPNGTFFTVELKLTLVNKIRFSPHQVSFHVKHVKNTFVLVACTPDKGKVRLYPGSEIISLVREGLSLSPQACGWDACRLALERL